MNESEPTISGQGDFLAFTQKAFEDSYDNVESDKKEVHREVVRRKGVAYSLKAIAVFGGIAMAAGLPATPAHIVGIAITVAVALDALFMNQLKLITLVKADNAYKHLLKDTANEQASKLGPVLQLKTTDQAAAKRQLSELYSSLKAHVDSEAKKIEIAIDESDVKALNALSLDSEKKGANTQGTSG